MPRLVAYRSLLKSEHRLHVRDLFDSTSSSDGVGLGVRRMPRAATPAPPCFAAYPAGGTPYTGVGAAKDAGRVCPGPELRGGRGPGAPRA